MRVAFLIDGGFFLKRYRVLYNKDNNAKQTADDLIKMINNHLEKMKLKFHKNVYRIFYYDCRPFSKKEHNPLTNKMIDFSKTDVANFKNEFLNELTQKRKIALRLGHIKDHNKWQIKPKKVKDLLREQIKINDLTENDVYFDLIQKGVDMKIGLDIASLAYKKLVNTIILISGDSDFISAAKLARREGIDFILDPMWQHIDDNLFEHIDGLQTVELKQKK